jgi:hypothetical protein
LPTSKGRRCLSPPRPLLPILLCIFLPDLSIRRHRRQSPQSRLSPLPVVVPLPRCLAWEGGGEGEDVDGEEFDERVCLRSASPRECCRARYSAYEQSLPYAPPLVRGDRGAHWPDPRSPKAALKTPLSPV